MKRTLIALGTLALAACGSDGTGPGEEVEAYDAVLSPSSIVGAVVPPGASGNSEVEYDETNLTYEIAVANIDGVTAAHIHGPAGTTQNGDVILTLFAPDFPTGLMNGTLVIGTVPPGSALLTPGITLDRVLTLIRADSAFVMVHSTEYPDGEIRGHLVP